MPKPIPKQQPLKAEVPEETPILEIYPDQTPPVEETPEETPKLEIVPEETPKVETIPEQTPPKEEMPSDELEENCVMFDGKKIEIKPTLLMYFRNKAMVGYNAIKQIPLHEFLTCGAGVFDETRDADQLLYDFLVAAFNDSSFVRSHYDEFDADFVDRVQKIIGRINHIDEKEEAQRKNREAQAQQKR